MIEVFQIKDEQDDTVLEVTNWGEGHVELAIYDNDGTQKFFQLRSDTEVLNLVDYLMDAIA